MLVQESRSLWGAALLQDIKKVVAVDYLLRCMAGQRTAIILVMLCQRIKG